MIILKYQDPLTGGCFDVSSQPSISFRNRCVAADFPHLLLLTYFACVRIFIVDGSVAVNNG